MKSHLLIAVGLVATAWMASGNGLGAGGNERNV
jgi:hypothetical protein